MIPLTKDALNLFHAGTKTLSRLEANGIKIDKEYYYIQRPKVKEEVSSLAYQIKTKSEIGKAWMKRFGEKAKLTSEDQFKVVLELDFQFDKFKINKKGNISADADVIAKLPMDFSIPFQKYKHLCKAYSSFINPILREVDNAGFLHPSFQLHTVKTMRGSCVDPNVQQQPKRDKFLKRLIRSGFIPRSPDRCLMEIDLKGAECAVGACIHKDPAMLAYVTNDALDMHRDSAMDAYILKLNQMNKDIRNAAKGDFVFAEFYGATFKSVAAAMWETLIDDKLKTAQGELVLDLLAKKGIADLESFTLHIRKVEDIFWNQRFKKYSEWKKETYEKYLRDGYLDIITGFRITQEMTKEQTLNTPIQGPSFHTLLHTLILMNGMFDKYKLKSLLIGQIHDSILGDIYRSELQTIQNLYWDAQDIVRKRWDWLEIEIRAEIEVAPEGKPWCDLEAMGFVERSA